MSTDVIITRGRLLKTGREYIIRELHKEDIFELHALHKLILSGLKPEQQQFIHHKSVSDFNKMIENRDQLVIGAFSEGRLIGYSSANFINERNMENVLPGFNLDYEPKKIVVLEQASVNPAFRGNNLASVMNACRQKIAFRNRGRKYAVTMVDINNYYSYRNGLRNGMCITQAAVDPEDGGHIVYLAKELGNPPVFNEEKGKIKVGYEEMRLDIVNMLLENGYVANSFNDEEKSVIFKHTNSFDDRHRFINRRRRGQSFGFRAAAGAGR